MVNINQEYCLGIGASSKVNNENDAKKISDLLQGHNIKFSYIATLDKFTNSVWLFYLKTHFKAEIRVFSIESLTQYQSKLLTPSDNLFHAIGSYGVAEAVALAAFPSNSKLIVPKTIGFGFTYAISQKTN